MAGVAAPAAEWRGTSRNPQRLTRLFSGAGIRVYPRGSIYTTIVELGHQNHNGDGLLGANSIIVVYMDPLGILLIIKP